MFKPLFLITVASALFIILWDFNPLEDFNIASDSDSVLLDNIEPLINARLISFDQANRLNQPVVSLLHWTLGINSPYCVSCLLDCVVNFHLFPLVHPNHGESEADQNYTQDEFSEKTTIFVPWCRPWRKVSFFGLSSNSDLRKSGSFSSLLCHSGDWSIFGRLIVGIIYLIFGRVFLLVTIHLFIFWSFVFLLICDGTLQQIGHAWLLQNCIDRVRVNQQTEEDTCDQKFTHFHFINWIIDKNL